MAYTHLDVASPDETVQNGAAVCAVLRTNFEAVRDYIALGVMPGFNYSVSGGTADQPATIFLKKGVEWIKQDLTWGTTGGASGNVTIIAISYSANSGGAYDAMGTCTIAYDSAANVTTTTWS